MEPIKTCEKDGKILRIYQDEFPENPREWDNLGTMLCFHKRYKLGDETDLKSVDFSSWDEIEEYLFKEKGAVIALPLYLYDHSGLYMKVGSWHGLLSQGHAEFDSGQVGFIYTTGERIRKEFDKKRITEKLIDKAEEILRQEVKGYAQYLGGDIYFYQVLQPEKCPTCGNVEDKVLDACGGYYELESILQETGFTEADGKE